MASTARRDRSSHETKAPRIQVLGAGKVGRNLARALAAAGSEVALRAAREGLPEKAIDADVILVTVRDGDIPKVAAALAERRLVGHAKVAILHCAGALGPEALAAARVGAASVAQMHPMISFASPDFLPSLDRGQLHVDGDPEAVAAGVEIAERLGMTARTIASLDRVAYHAAAGLVANGAAALAAGGVDLLERAGSIGGRRRRCWGRSCDPWRRTWRSWGCRARSRGRCDAGTRARSSVTSPRSTGSRRTSRRSMRRRRRRSSRWPARSPRLRRRRSRRSTRRCARGNRDVAVSGPWAWASASAGELLVAVVVVVVVVVVPVPAVVTTAVRVGPANGALVDRQRLLGGRLLRGRVFFAAGFFAAAFFAAGFFAVGFVAAAFFAAGFFAADVFGAAGVFFAAGFFAAAFFAAGFFAAAFFAAGFFAAVFLLPDSIRQLLPGPHAL